MNNIHKLKRDYFLGYSFLWFQKETGQSNSLKELHSFSFQNPELVVACPLLLPLGTLTSLECDTDIVHQKSRQNIYLRNSVCWNPGAIQEKASVSGI